MRNIRQRKIDPKKQMPVVIFYSLLNTYCNASKSSTTSTQENSVTSAGESPTSGLLNTIIEKFKKTNGFKSVENHYRNISSRLTMTDSEEMKMIMKESGLDEETLKSIRHAQEIADDQANNYTYDHTLDSDSHDGDHHGGSTNSSSSSRGGGLGNSRRGGSGAIKHSSHSDHHQTSVIPLENIFTPLVNITDIDNMELIPELENGITPSPDHGNNVRLDFISMKEKKRRRNIEQRTSRKKVKFQAPPQYIHFNDSSALEGVDTVKVLYDMEDEDFEWLSNFQTQYLEEYELCHCDKKQQIGTNNDIHIENMLNRWKVSNIEKLPTPSQVLHLIDEDFFEESIDRFEKTTGFSHDLCSFDSALCKYPSLGRYFFDIEIFTSKSIPPSIVIPPKKSKKRKSEKISRTNRFVKSPKPTIVSTHRVDDSDLYKTNLFDSISSLSTSKTPSTTYIPTPPPPIECISSSLGTPRPSSFLNNNNSTTSGSSNSSTSNSSLPPAITRSTCTNNHRETSVDNYEKVLPTQFLYEVYLFWKTKRLNRRVSGTEKQLYPRCGKPLLVDFEKETDINDLNPNAAFRPREFPKKQTEEILNDENSLYKLRKLRKELLTLQDLLLKVKEREEKKLEYVLLTKDILLFDSKPEPSKIISDSMIDLSTLERTLSIRETSPSNTPYYEPISEDAWKEQFKQDDSGHTSMNLLHFLEILKKHNKPFFPFLLKYVKKTRNFEGDENLPEQFNTLLPKYIPGSEYNVSLSSRRQSVIFDTESLDRQERERIDMRMDLRIDNLLTDEIENHRKLEEQREADEDTECTSGEMLLQILEDEQNKPPPIQSHMLSEPIVEVKLSEFEERSAYPNEEIDFTTIEYHRAEDNSFNFQ